MLRNFRDFVMSKRLQDMSLTELWELFPITLEPYNPIWNDWAEEEIGILCLLLSDFNPRIYHIGSTAAPGIHAKPIVDILVEVDHEADWSQIKASMEGNGYICMAETESRISFNKGYTTEGYAEKVFHIHFHRLGDNDEILFRDYLIDHPHAAKEYESLKLSLLPKFHNDRDGYTEAKTDFIKSVIANSKPRGTSPVHKY